MLHALSAEVSGFECLIQDYHAYRDLVKFILHWFGIHPLYWKVSPLWWVSIQGHPMMHSQHFFAGLF